MHVCFLTVAMNVVWHGELSYKKFFMNFSLIWAKCHCYCYYYPLLLRAFAAETQRPWIRIALSPIFLGFFSTPVKYISSQCKCQCYCHTQFYRRPRETIRVCSSRQNFLLEISYISVWFLDRISIRFYPWASREELKKAFTFPKRFYMTSWQPYIGVSKQSNGSHIGVANRSSGA